MKPFPLLLLASLRHMFRDSQMLHVWISYLRRKNGHIQEEIGKYSPTWSIWESPKILQSIEVGQHFPIGRFCPVSR